MIPYLLVGAFLWLVLLWTQNGEQNAGWSRTCLIVLIAFTGLRYEIGYDWLAYEKYFQWVGPSLTFDNYKMSVIALPVEYFYFLLNAAIKIMGGSFELLLFSVSAFNLFVIDRMAKEIDPSSRPFVWLMYFCLALIMVQFNIIRQSIASSFVIIALILICKRHYFRSIPAWVGSIGFHTSTAIFLPMIPFIHRRIKVSYVVTALIVSLFVFLAGNLFLADVISIIGSLLPGEISEKTDLYATGIAGGNVWGISPLAAALVLLYLAMLYIFFRLPHDPYINVAILLTALVLVAHVAFAQVPIFWNRVMCVSLPWQLAVLWKHWIKPLDPATRSAGLLGGGVAALSIFTFQLTRPENIAFVPYHSLAQVWLYNDEGDGRLRSMYAVRLGQIEQARRAATQ